MPKSHPHPGEPLRDDVLKPLGVAVTDAAARLGMSRVALKRILNGRAAIGPDVAIRQDRAGVSTARFWIILQANQDLSRAESRVQPPVRPLQAA